jgi:hypothetical protein
VRRPRVAPSRLVAPHDEEHAGDHAQQHVRQERFDQVAHVTFMMVRRGGGSTVPAVNNA